MLWGTMADKLGRRPVFIACLLVLSIACVGLALVPTDAYWLLVLLRCLQAAGPGSTIALGAGVISDIAEPFERGGFFGLLSLGPMVCTVLLYESYMDSFYYRWDRKSAPVLGSHILLIHVV